MEYGSLFFRKNLFPKYFFNRSNILKIDSQNFIISWFEIIDFLNCIKKLRNKVLFVEIKTGMSLYLKRLFVDLVDVLVHMIYIYRSYI